jgi:Asp-tRNA(Asn)/Glu-tRNA(Gln) amidotransferase C subunit
MAKSRAQQAAIAIAKMKKEELTELIKEALREVKEGNAFVDAARKAKEAGEEEFEFDGKVHKLQEIEASLAEEADTEIKVGNYQTKHYHICPGAKTLYQDIEDKVEDMDLAERTAKLQDALFAIEMRALEDGAVQADLDAAEIIADQIMAMARMMGLEKEHHYIQGHIDKIKGAIENVDEANKEIIVGNPTADAEEARKDQTIPSQFRTKVADTIKRSQKGDVVTAPAMEETLSVGHVDDEPGMLKQFAFDTAEYAVKLYKLLHHYEQMEDHVDFPNWWQHKVMMAREYMSKATHYLEFETMKPHLDAKIDGHSEEELDEIKKAEFEKIKPGKELQLRGYGVVTVVANDGIVMKIKDSLDKVHTINLGQYNEKFLKEDDDVEPSKKDIKAAEKDVKNVSDDKKQQFNRALAFIKKFKDNPGAVAGMLKKAREEYKLPKNLLKDLARAAQVSETLAEGVSCCGRCGRVHESAQDCKKPYISKDSPRHCKNKK